MAEYVELGNLKKMREKAGITQKYMAAFLGINRRTYQRYEQCETWTSTERARRIAGRLGVYMEEIVSPPAQADPEAKQPAFPTSETVELVLLERMDRIEARLCFIAEHLKAVTPPAPTKTEKKGYLSRFFSYFFPSETSRS